MHTELTDDQALLRNALEEGQRDKELQIIEQLLHYLSDNDRVCISYRDIAQCLYLTVSQVKAIVTVLSEAGKISIVDECVEVQVHSL